MEHLPESLKHFANRIAEAAVSDNAAEVVRLLRVSGFLGGPPNDDENTSSVSVAELDNAVGGTPPASYGDYVGVWKRKVVDGQVSFVRRMETMAEWNYWADVGRIEPKSDKTRVLLIGESVARGYLYDPVFNPAIALRMILESHFEGIEIIDLARTNLGFQIREVAINALQMEPDIAIIFAGNNWYISEPLPSEIAEIDDAITKHGIAGVKQAVEAQIARTSRRLVNDICAAYESKGVPLVWIIPEFNLRDWHDPVTNAPYLASGLNKEWLELMDEAQSALRDSDFKTAALLAHEMIQIDGGLCVAGFYILAECSRRANDVEGERKYLTLARDTTSWDISATTVPRAYSVMQEAVREETAKHNLQVIDLPALFEEYLKGEIPDRSLFLDYCHLTTKGIQVTMGAAASCVLRALKRVDIPGHALVGDKVAPSPETEAEALFLAAITNAHCSQPRELVRYFCRQALNHSRHIDRLMLNYIELQTQSAVPMRMSGAEEEMWRVGSPLVRNLLRLNVKRLDQLLFSAMLDALEEVGVKDRDRIRQLCLEEHSVTRSDTDLLDYYYCAAADQPQEMVWLNRTDQRFRPPAEYYRAYRPESKFIFVGEAGCPVHLSLTCRLPEPEARDTSIRLNLNGRAQLEIAISSTWGTWEIDLPGESVRDGLNEIAINWPLPEFAVSKSIEKARLKLMERKFPGFFPVFGEIHSFIASDGREVSTTSPTAQLESSLLEVA